MKCTTEYHSTLAQKLCDLVDATGALVELFCHECVRPFPDGRRVCGSKNCPLYSVTPLQEDEINL